MFHRDASRVLSKAGRKRTAHFTSDQLLRAIGVMEVEGLPYRETVVRIDDRQFLRRFVRVYDGEMMDHTLLCKAYKAVSPEAWQEMNRLLGRYAIEHERITGTCLPCRHHGVRDQRPLPDRLQPAVGWLSGDVSVDRSDPDLRRRGRRCGSSPGPSGQALDAADHAARREQGGRSEQTCKAVPSPVGACFARARLVARCGPECASGGRSNPTICR